MATITTLGFEGLTSGSPVTVSAPFSMTGDTPNAQSAAAMHGSIGARWASTATGGRIMWDNGSDWSGSRVLSFYVRWATFPTVSSYIATVFNTTSGTTQGDIRLETNGTLRTRNGGAATGTATAALSLNTWYRIEWQVGTGACVLRLYEGDGTTPISTSTGAWDSTTNRVLSFGPRNGAATGADMDIDSVVIADDWTGPYVAAPTDPELSAAVTDGVARIDATAAGGTPPYVYSISQTSGSTTTPVEVDDGVWIVSKPSSGNLVYEVTVTDDATLTDTSSVTVLPLGGSGGVGSGIKRPTGSLPSTTWV